MLSRCLTRDTWPVHRRYVWRLGLQLLSDIAACRSLWLRHLLSSALVMHPHLGWGKSSFAIANLLCFRLGQGFIIFKHIILVIFFVDDVLIYWFWVLNLHVRLLVFPVWLRAPLFLHLIAFQNTVCLGRLRPVLCDKLIMDQLTSNQIVCSYSFGVILPHENWLINDVGMWAPDRAIFCQRFLRIRICVFHIRAFLCCIIWPVIPSVARHICWFFVKIFCLLSFWIQCNKFILLLLKFTVRQFKDLVDFVNSWLRQSIHHQILRWIHARHLTIPVLSALGPSSIFLLAIWSTPGSQFLEFELLVLDQFLIHRLSLLASLSLFFFQNFIQKCVWIWAVYSFELAAKSNSEFAFGVWSERDWFSAGRLSCQGFPLYYVQEMISVTEWVLLVYVEIQSVINGFFHWASLYQVSGAYIFHVDVLWRRAIWHSFTLLIWRTAILLSRKRPGMWQRRRFASSAALMMS